jgi:hypothetical protein
MKMAEGSKAVFVCLLASFCQSPSVVQVGEKGLGAAKLAGSLQTVVGFFDHLMPVPILCGKERGLVLLE